MKEKGWVEFETVLQDDSPNKKVYSLTEAGRAELEKWLAEPGESSGGRNAFLAQLHFSDAISIEAQLRALEEHLSDLLDSIRKLQRRAESFSMPIPLPEEALRQGFTRTMFSLEYGIRKYQFEIEWIEDTIQILKNGEA